MGWMLLGLTLIAKFSAIHAQTTEDDDPNDKDDSNSSSWGSFARKLKGQQRKFLEQQVEMLKLEHQLRKDAQTGLTPDFWEIQRSGGQEDHYRLLEIVWVQRHLAVQLHSNPRYMVATPSDDEWAAMRKEVEDDCASVGRFRRLSRKPFNSTCTVPYQRGL